jgi:iron complex outermembrane receptor protein
VGDVEINLSPEKVDSIEAGLKGSVLDGRVSFEGTWFDMRRDNVVVWELRRTGRYGTMLVQANGGAHEYTGIETGLNWTATPQLSLHANSAWYRNRFGPDFVDYSLAQGLGGPVLAGNRLPLVPDSTINAGMVITPGLPVTIRLDVKYVGATMLDRGNTFELEPYTLLDAAVSWRRAPLRITLAAHNLFGQEYYWGGDTLTGGWADIGAPRQILLATSFSFR